MQSALAVNELVPGVKTFTTEAETSPLTHDIATAAQPPPHWLH